MIWTGIASIVSMLLGAVTMKIIALEGGPEGVALFSQMRQILQLAILIATLNSMNSLVREIAMRAPRDIFSYAVSICVLFFVSSFFVYTLIFFYSDSIVSPLFKADNGQMNEAVLILFLGVFPASLAIVVQGILNGTRQHRRLATMRIGAATAQATVALAVFLIAGPQKYAIILCASFLVSALIPFIWLPRVRCAISDFGLKTPHPNEIALSVRRHLKFAKYTFLTGSIGILSVIVIRSAFIREGGFGEAGLFDAAWTISSVYMMVLLTSVGTYFLPLLSGAKRDSDVNTQVMRIMRLVLFLGVPVITFGIALKPVITEVLYSNKFLGSVSLLNWTMMGDFFKITAWAFGLNIIARAEGRVFFLSETLQQLVLIASVATVFHPTLRNFGVGYLVAMASYFGGITLYNIRFLNVKIEPEIWRDWISAIILVMLLSYVFWQQSAFPSVWELVILVAAVGIYTMRLVLSQRYSGEIGMLRSSLSLFRASQR